MENLIVLAIIVLASAVHGWIKRRQGQDEAEPESWPGSPRPQPRPETRPAPKPATDWEEELRRLLQGEPKRPAAPPVLTREAPPPLPGGPRRIEEAPAPAPVSTTTHRSLVPSSATAPAETSPAFSHRPRHSAEEWQTSVGQRMKAAGVAAPARLGMPSPSRRAETRLARDLLKTRSSLRSAIVASILLGPPKSLDAS